ncbi:MAG: ATP-binding cassette domain-containing protein [Candidatus Manganitrophus sp.]|nr:MAG: ATP-binding cassette domain-containing protein [Candidatus Manganitrophus sp.]
MNIIEIKNADIYQGANQVFSDLSLQIAAGCQTAILGPNGAGKSTLLKLLSGEIRAASHKGASGSSDGSSGIFGKSARSSASSPTTCSAIICIPFGAGR